MRRLSPLPMLRRIGAFAVRESTAVSVSFFAGLGLTAVGVGMIYLPAGLITAGLELTAGSALYARGAGGST